MGRILFLVIVLGKCRADSDFSSYLCTSFYIIMDKRRLAVFASGNGTNCENLIRYFRNSDVAEVALVVSNRSEAGVLQRAAQLGCPSVVIKKQALTADEGVMDLMREYNIHFIVLAGFLPIIPDYLIEAYPNRIINIHPSLLPKFGGHGMWGHHVHEAVWAAKESETGMTVHYVSSVCDGGQIISQYAVPLLPTDTPDDIARKEHELEMKYFPLVVERLVRDINV